MPKNLNPKSVAAEQEAIAEQIALQGVDHAAAVPRPDNVANTWVEQEYEELEAEQEPLWKASGIEESRTSTVRAAGLEPTASASEELLSGHSVIVAASTARFADTAEALAPFRHRPSGAKPFHYGAKAGFLFGDIAGISTAAIWGGEIVAIAIIMSISAAIATVVAGLTGAQIRDLRDARRRTRDVDSLTDKQKPFQHLFAGRDLGVGIVRGLVGASFIVALLVGAAIFALRFSIQGELVGLVYGCIAVSIAAASFIESYMYADEVADQIDNAGHDYKKDLALHTHLAGSTNWRQHQEATAEETSITAEHAERGAAAQDRIRALKWGVLRRNPGVAGHGPTTGSPLVGRTTRKGGAAK